ncbi:MAG: HEAT repeat domain-containing protein [Bacteroidetes bacterium]|jgi:HEAT repeat protein|nr:HEAT repeat domain-containing protein [Bacteroidota bacterium]
MPEGLTGMSAVATATMNDEQRSLFSLVLTAPDPDARRQAAEALAEAGGPHAEMALVAALEDPNKGVRDAAARSLLRIGGPSVARALAPSIASRNIGTRNLASSLLMRLGQVAQAPLLPFVKDPNKDVRKFAIDILGEIMSTEATPWLVEALDDPDPNVVVSSLEAMGKIGDRAAVQPITEIFPRCTFAHTQIVETLGRLGGPRATIFLSELARMDNEHRFLDDVTWYALAEALAVCGNEASLEPLRQRLSRSADTLRRMILHAIVLIAEHSDGHVDLGDWVEDLRRSLAEDPIPVRLSAARALQAFEGEAITSDLARALGHDDDLDLQLFAQLAHRPRTFQALSSVLGEPVAGRREIVLLLGKLAREIMEGYAEGRLVDITAEDVDRASAAVEALWPDADQEVRFFLLETMFRLDGDRAVGFLMSMLSGSDPWFKVHVLELLFDVEDQRVLHIALACLQDEEETVRMTAQAALEARGISLPGFEAVTAN